MSKRLKESARTLSVRGPSFTLEKILQTVAGSEAEKSSGKKSLEYAKLEKKKKKIENFSVLRSTLEELLVRHLLVAARE